jgi:hypothetical protein
MSQADTPPVIKPYAGQLQDQDEKGSMFRDREGAPGNERAAAALLPLCSRQSQ